MHTTTFAQAQLTPKQPRPLPMECWPLGYEDEGNADAGSKSAWAMNHYTCTSPIPWSSMCQAGSNVICMARRPYILIRKDVSSFLYAKMMEWVHLGRDRVMTMNNVLG